MGQGRKSSGIGALAGNSRAERREAEGEPEAQAEHDARPLGDDEAVFTYLGGHQDTHVTPAVNKRGTDKKPIKRVYARMDTLERRNVETFKLWGFDFPVGEPQRLHEHDARFRESNTRLVELARKLKAFTCFRVEHTFEIPPKKKRTR